MCADVPVQLLLREPPPTPLWVITDQYKRMTTWSFWNKVYNITSLLQNLGESSPGTSQDPKKRSFQNKLLTPWGDAEDDIFLSTSKGPESSRFGLQALVCSWAVGQTTGSLQTEWSANLLWDGISNWNWNLINIKFISWASNATSVILTHLNSINLNI